jgi:hypothetical protein
LRTRIDLWELGLAGAHAVRLSERTREGERIVPFASRREGDGALTLGWVLSGKTPRFSERHYSIDTQGPKPKFDASAHLRDMPPLPGENLIPNPSFEEGLDHWTPSHQFREVAKADAPGATGRHALRIVSWDEKLGNRLFVQGPLVPIQPGTVLVASASCRAESATGLACFCQVKYCDKDGKPLRSPVFTKRALPLMRRGEIPPRTWIRLHGSARVAPDVHYVRVRIGMWNNKGESWFDDIELRADISSAPLAPDIVVGRPTAISSPDSEQRSGRRPSTEAQ